MWPFGARKKDLPDQFGEKLAKWGRRHAARPDFRKKHVQIDGEMPFATRALGVIGDFA